MTSEWAPEGFALRCPSRAPVRGTRTFFSHIFTEAGKRCARRKAQENQRVLAWFGGAEEGPWGQRESSWWEWLRVPPLQRTRPEKSAGTSLCSLFHPHRAERCPAWGTWHVTVVKPEQWQSLSEPNFSPLWSPKDASAPAERPAEVWLLFRVQDGGLQRRQQLGLRPLPSLTLLLGGTLHSADQGYRPLKERRFPNVPPVVYNADANPFPSLTSSVGMQSEFCWSSLCPWSAGELRSLWLRVSDPAPPPSPSYVSF